MNHAMRKLVYGLYEHPGSLISVFVIRCLGSKVPLFSILDASPGTDPGTLNIKEAYIPTTYGTNSGYAVFRQCQDADIYIAIATAK